MPNEGEAHPNYPGCFYRSAIATYVCDDGYTVDGAPASFIAGPFDGVTAGVDGQDSNLDVVRINAAPTTAAELEALLKHSGGSITVAANALELLVAGNHSWQFSVEKISDGQFKITATNYQNYAIGVAIGLFALILLVSFSGK